MAAIDTAFHNSYQNAFEVKFQQGASRLRPFITEYPQNAEFKFWDRVGTVNVSARTTRHAPTVLNDADHSRIRCSITDYRADALAFDSEDRLRMELNDPRMAYAQTQAMALGRKLDSVIIAAADGSTWTGKTGSVEETYTQTTYGVAVDAVAPGTAAANSNLTIEKLIRARSLLFSAEAVMDGESLVCVVTQSQINSLLRTTEITSADYNSVRALVAGQIDTFMGFKFVRTELLGTNASGYRKVLCFPKSAIIVGMAEGLKTRIDERPDLNYTWQVWSSSTFGAVRTWREKMVVVLCDEAA